MKIVQRFVRVFNFWIGKAFPISLVLLLELIQPWPQRIHNENILTTALS